MPRKREPEIDYLRRLESLVAALVNTAAQEDWFTFEHDESHDPLQTEIVELARTIRIVHTPDDGCITED